VEQEDGFQESLLLITVGLAQRFPSRGNNHFSFRHKIALDEARSKLLLII